MSMVINTNVASLASQRHLASSRADMEQAMERLSSGKRINSAMDDAAGLSISHSLDSKITSLNQAVRNANDGVAMVNLAEGAMDEISSMLTRMKELATQAQNGTYTSGSGTDGDNLDNLNQEFTALKDEITRIATSTDFNGISVLNSSATAKFQIGDGAVDGVDNISVTMQSMTAGSIGADSGTETVTDAAVAVFSDLTAAGANDAAIVINGAWITEGTKVGISFDEASATALSYADTDYNVDFDTDVETTLDNLAAAIAAGEAIAVSDISITNSGDVWTISFADGNNVLAVSDNVNVGAFNVTSAGQTHLDAAKIDSVSEAADAMAQIDQAIKDVDSYRSELGAVANRLDHASANLMSRVEHQSAARSRIEDADYAVESANLAKAQVLQQAGTAMLSQANASTQNVLSLLK